MSGHKVPPVSVIMNCHNGEQYLREAIDSVISQTYENWEIVFWDNASSDASGVIAKSYGNRIRYFRGDSLVPLYTARNLALEHCCGQVVTFLDCDDIWLPEKLESQVALFCEGNKIVYGGYETIGANGEQQGEVNHQNASGWLTRLLLRKNPISIGCVMVDADLLREYRFDPTYDLLGDFDLWIRLSLAYPFGCVDGVVELSRQHGNNLSLQRREKWLHERRYFYRKFLQIASVLRYPGILGYIAKTELKGLLNVA